ncbi:MAG: phosphate ABC transporter substrate-binding protein [Verrucomicrobiales bacterium]|nr:phosphate ABC transporter substrate-binding protein [Verrucomicrobiales bacterium]
MSSLLKLHPVSAVFGAFLCLNQSCTDSSAVEKITVTGSSTLAPLVADMAGLFEAKNPGIRIDVQAGGSSRGILDASSSLADIGMTSRNLKAGENGLTSHRIALDGIALIVHSQNPVSDLSHDQVISIFTGKTEFWNEGNDRKIVVVNKAEGRGTLEVFLKHFELDSADIDADLIVGENQQAIKTVSGNPLAIGYVSIGAAEYEAANGTPIRLLAVDGVTATSKTVAEGTYPISRPLLLVTKGHAVPAGLTGRFVEFCQSTAVHELIGSHLYVPVRE